MTIVRDENASVDALAIVEKYEAFVNYVYNVLENCPRQHRVLRDTVLGALFPPIGGLYHAARSRQMSRLHAVDAEFATLRSYLRFLQQRRVISLHQQGRALALLAEPGRMLGAWKRKLSTGSAAHARPVGQAGK